MAAIFFVLKQLEIIMSKSNKKQSSAASMMNLHNSFYKHNDAEIAKLNSFGFLVKILADASIRIMNESDTIVFKYKNYDNAAEFRRTIHPLYGLLQARQDYVKERGQDEPLTNYVLHNMVITNSRLLVNQEIFGKMYYEGISEQVILDWQALYRYLRIAYRNGSLINEFVKSEIEEYAPEHYRILDNSNRARFICRAEFKPDQPDYLYFYTFILLFGAPIAVKHIHAGMRVTWRLLEQNIRVNKEEFFLYQNLYGTDGLTTLRGVYSKNLPENAIALDEVDMSGDFFE